MSFDAISFRLYISGLSRPRVPLSYRTTSHLNRPLLNLAVNINYHSLFSLVHFMHFTKSNFEVPIICRARITRRMNVLISLKHVNPMRDIFLGIFPFKLQRLEQPVKPITAEPGSSYPESAQSHLGIFEPLTRGPPLLCQSRGASACHRQQ